MSGVNAGNILQSIQRGKSFSRPGNGVARQATKKFDPSFDPFVETESQSIRESLISQQEMKARFEKTLTAIEDDPEESFLAGEGLFQYDICSDSPKPAQAASSKVAPAPQNDDNGTDSGQTKSSHRRNMDDSYSISELENSEKYDKVTDLQQATPAMKRSEASRRWRKLAVVTDTIKALRTIENEIRMFGAPVPDADKPSESSRRDTRSFSRQYSSFLMKKTQLNAPWYILLPDSRIRKCWELFVVFMLIYVIITVPIRVCFDMEPSTGSADTLDLIVDILFIVDIFVNCVCAYREKDGTTVVSQKRIMYHYARTWLILDVIASVPVYRIMDATGADTGDGQLNRLSKIARLPRLFRLFKLLRLLKLLRVVKLIRYFNRWEQQTLGINVGLQRMIKVTFGVFMVTHLIGCFWYFISWIGYEEMPTESWVYRHGIQDADHLSKYVASMYWSFSTLTTVGFGDISAKTNQERVFSIICMVVGVSWYAFIVSTISSIISMFDRKSAEIKRKQRLIVQFMRETRVPFDLKKRILDYFDYVTSLDTIEANSQEMESVLSMLSTQLRTEVTLHVHRNLIPQVPFFYNKTPQFIAACASLLRPLMFQPGEYISTRGQHADEMYFLTSGRANVVLENGTIFKTIVQGSYFGEIGCMLSEIHRVSIRAWMECQVYSLAKADLKSLMLDYPDVASEIRLTAKKRIEHLNGGGGGDKNQEPMLNVVTSFPGAEFDADTRRSSVATAAEEDYLRHVDDMEKLGEKPSPLFDKPSTPTTPTLDETMPKVSAASEAYPLGFEKQGDLELDTSQLKTRLDQLEESMKTAEAERRTIIDTMMKLENLMSTIAAK